MRKLFSIALAAAFGCAPALAGEGVGAADETVVAMEAKVVDLACELAKVCPPDCGAGKHQLGLLTADGKLRPAVKASTIFAAPVLDLLPWCGRTVAVDGLLVQNPAMTIYYVQGIRAKAGEDYAPTDAFERKWIAAHGPSEEWFRNDPLVKEIIAKDGIVGIRGVAPKPQ